MKKRFTSDSAFRFYTVFGAAGTVVASVLNLIFYPELVLTVVIDLLRVLCVITLFVSYKKHSKNVMKGMMGALLMLMIVHAVACVSNNYSGTARERIASIIYVALSAGLFVNHFVITGERIAKPEQVALNQVLCALMVVAMILISGSVVETENSILERLGEFLYTLSFASSVASVICVESRLDAYRLEREKAGWTEEAGYPEEYGRTEQNKQEK